jgi:hypothetical protein
MGDNTQNIITLEDGWNHEIKVIALDPLEVGLSLLPFQSESLSLLPFYDIRHIHIRHTTYDIRPMTYGIMAYGI